MTTQKLPHAKTIYTLALFSCILFCFGGFAIVLAGFSFYLANKSLTLYKAQPGLYSNVGAIKKGRIIAIIGLVLNIFIIAVTIWTLSTIGWDAWSEEFVRKWNEGLESR